MCTCYSAVIQFSIACKSIHEKLCKIVPFLVHCVRILINLILLLLRKFSARPLEKHHFHSRFYCQWPKFCILNNSGTLINACRGGMLHFGFRPAKKHPLTFKNDEQMSKLQWNAVGVCTTHVKYAAFHQSQHTRTHT